MYDKSKEKIEVTLPDSLISEVDSIVQMENSNREDFQFYITQKKKIHIKESMKTGYREMGQINLSLAELGMTVEEVSSDDKNEGKIAQGEY